MLFLLMIIVILITYLVTHNYEKKNLTRVQEELRDEFQNHLTKKEQDHLAQINFLNSGFNKKLYAQADEFTKKYTALKDEYQGLVDEGRKDAVKRSKNVVSGQIYEQISPLVPGFPYQLKDVRHVGSPLDFLVFCGLHDNNAELEIVFLEIKSGMSALNSNERRVKRAVEAGRVRYDVFHPDIDHDVDESLEASIVPLPLGISTARIQPGEMIVSAPSNSISLSDDGVETLKCGHCKKNFQRQIAPGRKPLFCPTCRGTG